MRLKELVKKTGKLQKEVAAELGIEASTFNTYVNEKRKMPYSVLLKIAAYFNVSVEYLMGGPVEKPNVEEYDKPIMMLPVYGMIRAGLPVLMEEDVEEYVPMPAKGHPDDWLALRVEGDSMNAAGIVDGAIAVFHREPTVENGKIAAVAVDGEATVKTFYQEGSTILLFPNSTNPEHKVQKYDLREHDVRILGVVDSVIIRLA